MYAICSVAFRDFVDTLFGKRGFCVGFRDFNLIFGFGVTEDGNRFGHGGGFTGISANLDIFRDSDWIAIVMSNYSRASQPVSSKMRRLIAAAKQ